MVSEDALPDLLRVSHLFTVNHGGDLQRLLVGFKGNFESFPVGRAFGVVFLQSSESASELLLPQVQEHEEVALLSKARNWLGLLRKEKRARRYGRWNKSRFERYLVV